MPFFDFYCKKCKKTDELLVREEWPKCAICSTKLTKIVSAPKAFILKGEGFYKRSQ
jgi:putative FmdB family regulatory protein